MRGNHRCDRHCGHDGCVSIITIGSAVVVWPTCAVCQTSAPSLPAALVCSAQPTSLLLFTPSHIHTSLSSVSWLPQL